MTTTFQLIARSGPTAGNVYSLEEEEIFIGRDLNNDIVINDPEVSRRHLRFYKQAGTYTIEDLGSTNGTLINGQRVSGVYTLNSGEEITLGEHVHLVFERISEGHTDETVLSHKAVQTERSYGSAIDIQPDYYAQAEPDFLQEVASSAQYAGQVPDQPQKSLPKKAGWKKLPLWAIIIIVLVLVVMCVCSITAFLMPAEWWCAIDIFQIFQGCPR